MSALSATSVGADDHDAWAAENAAVGGRRGSGNEAVAGGARWASAVADDPVARLVTLAREGDQQAFEQLVRVTSPACYSLAYRLVGDEHDARDVVQDAYLRAYRSLRRFRGDSTFSTWLHRITVNCAADLLERRRRTSHDVLDDRADAVAFVEMRTERNPESAASTNDDRERLVEALLTLPDELRLVVVLRDVYDLPHREIAKELGITQGAAKVRLHRARLRLRERLFPSRQHSDHTDATSDGGAAAPRGEDGGVSESDGGVAASELVGGSSR